MIVQCSQELVGVIQELSLITASGVLQIQFDGSHTITRNHTWLKYQTLSFGNLFQQTFGEQSAYYGTGALEVIYERPESVPTLLPWLQFDDVHTIGHTLSCHEAVTSHTLIVLDLLGILDDVLHLVQDGISSGQVVTGNTIDHHHTGTLVFLRNQT